MNHVPRAIVLLFLAFLSVQPAGAESKLYFPRISTSGINGLTIFNPGSGTAPATAADDEITLSLYDTNGDLVAGQGITNPAVVVVSAGQNTAVTVVEVFGPVDPSVVGWVEGISPSDGLTGFFLFLTSDQSQLDGADQPQISRKIAFNDIRESAEFTTEINIFNTADTTTRLDLLLLTPDEVLDPITVGAPPAQGFAPTFPARGLLHIDNVAEFFDVAVIPEGSYLEVLSETPIGGFQFLRTAGGDLLGLNAKRRLEHLKVLYFPQLVVRGPWKMEVNVVNYSLEPVSLVFSASQPGGDLYGIGTVQQNPVRRDLDPFFAFVENVEDLFGFTGAGPFEGSLRVEAYPQGTAPLGVNGGGGEPIAAINGSVRYGVVATGSEAAVAALPAARKRAVFSHLATVEGFFTGFAAYNSSSAASNLRVMAFTEAGVELGLFDTVLGPGQRIAELLTNIMPGAAGQNGGYVWAEGSQPLHFSSLFGSSNSILLANVPPQPVPDGFLPDAGKPDFQVDPAAALVNLGGESSFGTQGGSGAETEWTINGEPGGSAALGEIDEAGDYGAPGDFPEPAGPLTLVAEEDGLIAAATIDLLEPGNFNPEPIPGIVRDLAYVASMDALFGVLLASGGQAPAGGMSTYSVIEIEESLQTTLVDFGEERIVDILAFESSVGEAFLLVLSQSGGRILRVDPETGAFEERVTGLDGPLDMAWNQVTGNLLVGDEGSVYSVSRAQLESDLVSGIPENGRAPVALLDVSNFNDGYALAPDACTGLIFLTDHGAGEIRSFDPVSGEISLVADGLDFPASTLVLYRKDAGCSAALRFLVADTGGADQGISLIDPAGLEALSFAAFPSPSHLLFIPEGLGLQDTVLLAARPFDDKGEPTSGVVTLRVPDQYQSGPTNVVGLGIPGSVADPLGDTYGIDAVQQDILDISAYYDTSDLHVTVVFAESISPCNEQCVGGLLPVDALKGFLDLDLDRDASTGGLAFSDLNSPADTGLGVEACAAFEFYDEEEGGLPIFLLNGEFFDVVGYVPVDFDTHSVSFSIPLSMLGQEGPMNLAGVFGTSSNHTDVAPNIGFITSVPKQAASPQDSLRNPGAAPSRNGPRYRRSRIGGWIGLRPATDPPE